VTGITVVDNNIYIRGLGERYAAVMLADSAIPSPDPDKRVVPLDIFPVSLLDNLTILKTFAPQMPGEFCGGIIKISPRDYPEENFFKISVGTGMDLDVIPFHNSYWTYKGGQFDWLGYDDGTRTLPGAVPDNIANIANQTENKMEAIGESFPYILTPYKKKAFLPHKISISFGDSRLTPGKARIGYLVSAMYKGSVDEKAKASINRTYDGDLQKEYSNVNSARKVKIGLLGSLGVIPLPAHKFRFTSFYSHNHKDNTIVEIGQTGLETRVYKKYILNFENNDLFFTQLTGTHFLKKLNNIIVKWNGSFGRAKHSEPDKRSTELRTEMGDDDPESDGYFLQYFHRIFREFLEHKENSLGFNTEIQIPYKQWQGLNSRLYSGADLSIKKRDTKERIFQYEDGDIYCDKDHGEPIEDYLNDENMVGFASTPDEIDLHEVTDSSSYIGKLKILAFYLKTDLPLMRRLQFSGGIRYENSLMEMYDNNIWENDIVLIRDDALTRHNFLPSANFIFSPHHNINLRLSYSKSIARPDFREAVAISYNLNEGGKQVFGNDDLKQVDIHSADIRFELYPSELEIFSVSAFYKYIQKPIELLELFTSNPDEMKYKYRNGEFAHNLGMEIEIKKNFGFLNRFFKDFYISGNFAYIYSQIKVKDRPASVYAQKKRPMQGQSPYVVNATIGYQNKNIGITSTLLLNMVGKRIAAVTIIPGGYEKEVGDVYEKPAPELDFVFKKTFSQKGSLKFSFKNILDKEYKIIRDEKIFGRQKKGRSINLSYSLKIQN
ncbi:MAG TPA: TonB-dependent receptor, partial [Spirochaetota bacterium]|nr:TonB-dependent receptor [Spirochaetota bacterium]